MEAHIEEIPVASNYLIENSFVNGRILGKVIEVYDHFSPSTTKLQQHLNLQGGAEKCALLVPVFWVVRA